MSLQSLFSGFLVSAACDNLTTANYFALGSFYPYIFLCGKYINFLTKQRMTLIWLELNMQGI